MIKTSMFFLLMAITCATSTNAGITIHFEGTALSSSAVTNVLSVVEAAAKKNKWKLEDASAKQGHLDRLIDYKEKNYEGNLTGVVIQVAENCEPLYFQFGDDLIMQDFVKTQFAGAEVHVQIIELLESIRSLFKKFAVDDEGEFWERHDRIFLAGKIQEVNLMIEGVKKKDPKAHGPFHLKSGRIIDVIH